MKCLVVTKRLIPAFQRCLGQNLSAIGMDAVAALPFIEEQALVTNLVGDQDPLAHRIEKALFLVNHALWKKLQEPLWLDATDQPYERLLRVGKRLVFVFSEEHLLALHLMRAGRLRWGAADAAIIAGMIHTGDYAIAQIKEHLSAAGVPVRKKW